MREMICNDVGLMNFARGLRVTRGSATQCHPNLAEPRVKRHTDRLAAIRLHLTSAANAQSGGCCSITADCDSDDQVRGCRLESGVLLADAEHLHVEEDCLLFLYSTSNLPQLHHSACQAGQSER